MLQDEIKKLKSRINDLQATIDNQKDRLVNLQMNNINPSDKETNELIQNQLNQIEYVSVLCFISFLFSLAIYLESLQKVYEEDS